MQTAIIMGDDTAVLDLQNDEDLESITKTEDDDRKHKHYGYHATVLLHVTGTKTSKF
jgi:hypothetical protein